MQLSALAEKERELAAARQRASTLEAEVADLEQECVLRQAQETALKEAVRDLEREMERQRLPGKTGEVKCNQVQGGEQLGWRARRHSCTCGKCHYECALCLPLTSACPLDCYRSCS